MSSRAQLDKAQNKIWPPSAAELLQHKMASTGRSTSNHLKTDPKTDYSLTSKSKRHSSRSSISGDPLAPSRPAKSTITSKSNVYHSSSSTEYITKPAIHTTSRSVLYSQDLHDPRARQSSTRNHEGATRTLKSTKGKAVQDPHISYPTFMPQPPPPTSSSHSAWPPQAEVKSDAPRKHRSKDKDKEKVKVKEHEELRPQGHEREGSKDIVKDSHEQRQPAYSTTTLGRSFKRTDDVKKQIKVSSSHRRYHTDDDILIAQPQRNPPPEQQRPIMLPNQAPQPTATTTIPETQVQGNDIHRTASRDNRSYSPPPAPLVAPVWLPGRDKGRDSRSKSYKSHDRMPFANQQSGPSGSDTDREARSTRHEYRTHQRETSNDNIQVPKGSHKKESRMSLTGWFSKKPPKLPVESPIMPTPNSVFFSPLPERTIPAPHLFSLSAGQGPSDLQHPYLHNDQSYHDPLNKTPSASTRSLFPPLESVSRKHHRSQPAQLPVKSGSTGTLGPIESNANSTALRSAPIGAELQATPIPPPSAHQPGTAVVVPPRAHTPAVQPAYALPSRSHTPAHRQQTPAIAPSSLPQPNPTPAAPTRAHQNHSSHDVSQPYGNYRDQDQPYDGNFSSSRLHISSVQSHQEHPVNSSRETINAVGYQHQISVPPRRPTTPAISSLPALSQFVTPRPKLNIAQTPATKQTVLPQSSNSFTGVKATPDVGGVPDVPQHQLSNLSSGHNITSDDVRRLTHNTSPLSVDPNVNPSIRHPGQSSQIPQPHTINIPDQRDIPEIGPAPKPTYVDLYPPGYASVSAITLQVPTNSAGGNEVKKSGKTKPSPPVEASVMLSDSMSKNEQPGRAVEQNSWSGTLNVSPPSSSRTDGEGHGISSTMASPGVSTTSRSSPMQLPSSVQPTPRGNALQIPTIYDQSFLSQQQGLTAGQYSGSRPSPKPSPAGSYLTVPIQSAHPSPSRHTNSYDSRLFGTPSSSSTIMQPPTPRTKSSHSPLKEPLLQPPDPKDQIGFVNSGTSGHSPSRAVQLQELDGSSHGPPKALTPITVPADVNDSRPHTKSRGHSHDHGSQSQTQLQPIRSSTEPGQGVTRRNSTQSLQAGTVNPVSLRSVQSPQPNVRPNLHDPYSTQDIHIMPQTYPPPSNAPPTEPLRTEVASPPRQELQLATSGSYVPRSRKRTTSQSSNAGDVRTDLHVPGSRSHQQPVPAPSRQRREKPPVQPVAHPTVSPIATQISSSRAASNNTSHISSSIQHASLSRHTPNDHPNVSLPYSPDPIPASALLSPTPSSRHHAYQSGSVGRSTRPPVSPAGHSRAASDPPPGSQPLRVAVAGHLSTPAPTPDQLPPPTPAQEAELLMTPSSLAPTLKRQPSYTATRPPSTQSADSKKKGGLFSLFRSISSSAKQREVPVPVVVPQPEQKPAKLRRSTSSRYKVEELEAIKSPGSSMTRVIALPPIVQQSHNTPINAHAQDKKGPPPKGFHPWKLLSKRNRTISAASVEALDGTGTGTHVNSPEGSVRSSATSGIYPPLRDPMLATQEWRNREEMDLADRGTIRRRRPGVTFELLDDTTSEPRSRPQRASKLR